MERGIDKQRPVTEARYVDHRNIEWVMCELHHIQNQLASVSYRSASTGFSACLLMHKLRTIVRDMKEGNMKMLITGGGVAALTIALIAGPVLTQPAFAEESNSVIVGGKSIGADPDANVRLQMRRDAGSEGF